MKALIIYDDVSCATNAKAMLHRASHRADVALKWDISPWRLDMLKSSLTAGEALLDAVDAHLIIFAVRRLPKRRGWLMDWLQQWVGRRLMPDAAVAISGDGTAAATVELSRFARQRGLSVVFNEPMPVSPPLLPAFSPPVIGVGD